MLSTTQIVGICLSLLMCALAGYGMGYAKAEHDRQRYDAYRKANNGRIAPTPTYKIPVPKRKAK